MKKLIDLEALTPKKLRTLRNNLNNRLESFKLKGEEAKNLAKSHMLFEKGEAECKELLVKVKRLLKPRD